MKQVEVTKSSHKNSAFMQNSTSRIALRQRVFNLNPISPFWHQVFTHGKKSLQNSEKISPYENDSLDDKKIKKHSTDHTHL